MNKFNIKQFQYRINESNHKTSIFKFTLLGLMVFSTVFMFSQKEENVTSIKFLYKNDNSIKHYENGKVSDYTLRDESGIYDVLFQQSETAYNIDSSLRKRLLNENMYFFNAIKSPFENVWLYTETTHQNGEFNLVLFDVQKSKKKILFNNLNTPFKGNSFYPVAWTKNKNEVYVELYVELGVEHQGIYKLNLKSKKLTKINISDKYMVTPEISPDFKYLLYSATSEVTRNFVWGDHDLLFIYDLENNIEIPINKEAGSVFIYGWLVDEKSKENNKSKYNPPNQVSQNSQLNFHLPYDRNVHYCIVRTGDPPPPIIGGPYGSKCSSSYYGYKPHTYVAIDFDSPNNTFDPVLAVESGKVIKSQNFCSGNKYGKHVRILHSDGSQSLYAHLNNVFVTLNQQVNKGCVLGDGGNTETEQNPNCNNPANDGDHIHFEYRTPNGKLAYPIFSECACIPLQAYGYTSQNFQNACQVCNVPANIFATNITSNFANIFIDNSQNAALFKIFIKPNYSNNFETYTVTSLPFYMTNLLPNTYYDYKISVYCNGIGWSNTSSLYTFKTLSTTSSCQSPTNLYTSFVNSNSVTINWNSPNSISYNYYLKPLNLPNYWQFNNYTYKPVGFNGLTPNTTYNFKVSATCLNGETSPISDVLTFTTPSFSNIRQNSVSDFGNHEISYIDINSTIIVYPNPAFYGQDISIKNLSGEYEISVYDNLGKKVYFYKGSESKINLPSNLTPNIYTVLCNSESGNKSTRFILLNK